MTTLQSAEAPALQLTPAGCEQFKSDGFLTVGSVFSEREIAKLRDAVSELNEEIERSGGQNNTVHMLEITEKNPIFLDLARDPRLVSHLIPLIGPNIQLHHSKIATQAKAKGRGGFGWHQDFVFFPHTNTDLVAVMVMLDDATPENGCMQMLRGSHHGGPRNHDKDGVFVGRCQEDSLWEDHPEDVIPITPPAGGLSIHHCLTLHGSGVNISGNPRRGLVFQYRAADAYQLAEAIWKDSGLLISGSLSEWVRCESQTVHLPRYQHQLPRPGENRYGGAWNQDGEFARQQNG